MFNSLLVELGYFDKITVGFLIIGHTHASIEQYFSCLRNLIRNAAFIASPLALQHLFSIEKLYIPTNKKKKSKYRTPMLQIQLLYVHDYVSFFAPYWNPSIKGYGTPYQFQFFAVLGKAVCQYKQFSEEGLKWLPIAPQFGILTVEQLYKENVTIILDQLSLASKEGKHALMKHLRIVQDSNNSSSTIADAFVENKDNIRDMAGTFQKAFPLLRDSVSVKGVLEQDLRREDEANGINYIERYEVQDMLGAQATLSSQNSKENGMLL
jgi:hypothetical protein